MKTFWIPYDQVQQAASHLHAPPCRPNELSPTAGAASTTLPTGHVRVPSFTLGSGQQRPIPRRETPRIGFHLRQRGPSPQNHAELQFAEKRQVASSDGRTIECGDSMIPAGCSETHARRNRCRRAAARLDGPRRGRGNSTPSLAAWGPKSPDARRRTESHASMDTRPVRTNRRRIRRGEEIRECDRRKPCPFFS